MIYQVTEVNLREKITVKFDYHARSAKHAIKMVANRVGNPHHGGKHGFLVFNRCGDEAATNYCKYTAAQSPQTKEQDNG